MKVLEKDIKHRELMIKAVTKMTIDLLYFSVKQLDLICYFKFFVSNFPPLFLLRFDYFGFEQACFP